MQHVDPIIRRSRETAATVKTLQDADGRHWTQPFLSKSEILSVYIQCRDLLFGPPWTTTRSVTRYRSVSWRQLFWSFKRNAEVTPAFCTPSTQPGFHCGEIRTRKLIRRRLRWCYVLTRICDKNRSSTQNCGHRYSTCHAVCRPYNKTFARDSRHS